LCTVGFQQFILGQLCVLRVPRSTRLSQAGSSRVRNRKQEVIRQDDLSTLDCGVHQENNNRLRVCVQKEEEEGVIETDRDQTVLS